MPETEAPPTPDAATGAEIQERLRTFLHVARRFMSLVTYGDPDGTACADVRCPGESHDLIQAELPLAAMDLEWATAALADRCAPFFGCRDLWATGAALSWFCAAFADILDRWGFPRAMLEMPDGTFRVRWGFPDVAIPADRPALGIRPEEQAVMQRALHLLEWAARVPRLEGEVRDHRVWIRWPTVDHRTRTVAVGSETYPVTEAGAVMFQAYVDARGQWLTDAQLEEFSDLLKPKAELVRAALPAPLRDLIQTKRGTGSRLKVEAIGKASPDFVRCYLAERD